jgi:hypothetical protein
LAAAVEMDGFYFHGFPDGKIRNTAVNTVSTWPTTGFITADSYGSGLLAIHRQKDQIIAWTKNRTEFFFNNGNPTGSPLLRIDQNTIGVGLAHRHSLAWAGEAACFVSENSADGDGGRSVYMIASLGKVSEISKPSLNRILAAEGLSISSCSAWMERLAGHEVYCLNLAAANRTFVYNLDAGLWDEWTNTTSTRFNVVSVTSRNGVVYAQDATNGRIYTFQRTVYQDGGSNFPVILQTARSNFGSGKKKYENELELRRSARRPRASTTSSWEPMPARTPSRWSTTSCRSSSRWRRRATRGGGNPPPVCWRWPMRAWGIWAASCSR